MADQPSIRLNKVLRELNISLDRAVEFLNQKGVEIDARPTTKITSEVYTILLDEFETDKSKKVASHELGEEKIKEKESLRIIQ
jgi:translation initiation factor IF-2